MCPNESREWYGLHTNVLMTMKKLTGLMFTAWHVPSVRVAVW